jgi:hypothetical protein
MAVRPVTRFAGALPKAGNAAAECEDAFCLAGSQLAVADGATEGSYSQIWATILAQSFCETDAAAWDAAGFSAWIEACQREWSIWERDLAHKELPWFTREKLREGSFAAFLGLTLSADGWRAFACGDSCLLIVRGDRVVESFPLDRSEDFGNVPVLVASSRPVLDGCLEIRGGEALAGDRIYLASDALACWFLASCENGEEPWNRLAQVGSDTDLQRLVADERAQGRLRNDDVTLVSVEIADA